MQDRLTCEQDLLKTIRQTLCKGMSTSWGIHTGQPVCPFILHSIASEFAFFTGSINEIPRRAREDWFRYNR
jgi:hypothetical protein